MYRPQRGRRCASIGIKVAMTLSLAASTRAASIEPLVVRAPASTLAKFKSTRTRAQYVKPSGEAVSLKDLGAKPLSLASGDINRDG